MDVADGKLTCERQAEYGYDTVEIDLPAVISVGDAINEPRYPSLKAIMGAKKKPLDSKAIGDVGIESDRVGEGGSRTAVLELKPPPEKQAGEIIEDEDTNETVEKIVAWLEERKLICWREFSFTPFTTTRATSTRTPSAPSPRRRSSPASWAPRPPLWWSAMSPTRPRPGSANSVSARSTAPRRRRRAWRSRSST
jgi:hypothetical protein